MADLPGALRLPSTFPFVGRSAELEALRALSPEAEGDGRRVVLVGGEAGSGKSRLVREFAAEAALAGARLAAEQDDAAAVALALGAQRAESLEFGRAADEGERRRQPQRTGEVSH